MNEQSTNKIQRQARIISHALVELRKYKWWPFGIKSAVLLDITVQGFKIEFTGATFCKKDDRFTMQIPLSPFGILSPQFITIQVCVKWFDPQKMRIGGIFENIDRPTFLFLEKIVEKVKEQDLGTY